MAHRNNVHSDQDLDGVVGWNPLLDSQLPAILRDGILRAFVDAEGALEPQVQPIDTRRLYDPQRTTESPRLGKLAQPENQ
jgi:hypothetical protein